MVDSKHIAHWLLIRPAHRRSLNMMRFSLTLNLKFAMKFRGTSSSLIHNTGKKVDITYSHGS